jgi:phosphoribosylformylglycinamidine cyclo-ligase
MIQKIKILFLLNFFLVNVAFSKELPALFEVKIPVLVGCTDGVGTKVALSQAHNKTHLTGQDLVAMCVNDMVTCGAEPLFFLDYFAASKLDPKSTAKIVKGIANACKKSNCALLGGETAEMPGHYAKNNFDLAGFSVGCVDEDKIITNTNVKDGNVLIGIESSGPHSNGFSLIRRIIKNSNATMEVKEEIVKKSLKPTILYPKLVMDLIENEKINSLAHITGGGLTENLPRSITKDLAIKIDTGSWEFPDIFKWLEKEGDISKSDMYRIFNCGIGMVIFVDKDEVNIICERITKMGYKNFVFE